MNPIFSVKHCFRKCTFFNQNVFSVTFSNSLRQRHLNAIDSPLKWLFWPFEKTSLQTTRDQQFAIFNSSSYLYKLYRWKCVCVGSWLYSFSKWSGEFLNVFVYVLCVCVCPREWERGREREWLSEWVTDWVSGESINDWVGFSRLRTLNWHQKPLFLIFDRFILKIRDVWHY